MMCLRFALLALVLVEAAYGQFPLGPEFQVNTYTTGPQYASAVAVDPSGGFVIVWYGIGASDNDDTGISGQRYSSDGSPVGGEFSVNSYTLDRQTQPAVAADSQGNFVVVWNGIGSSGTDDDFYSIKGRRFASDGSPIGDDFQVNTTTTFAQRSPAVAVGAEGHFVVVWESDWSAGTDTFGSSVQGQRFDSGGVPIGGEFQVNTYTSDNQGPGVDVAMTSEGGFVIVWRSNGSTGTDSSLDSIQGQRFAENGARIGSEFQINSITTFGQREPVVAARSTGEFVVAWQSIVDVYGAQFGIQAQRFDSNGVPMGKEFQVETYTTEDQFAPSVAMTPLGDFVVTWTSEGSSDPDTSYRSVQGQRFASSGMPIGPQFQINSYTTSTPRNQKFSVDIDSDGNFVVVWQSGGVSEDGPDGDRASVRARRFASMLFGDSFESGDTSAWSATVGE